jgi:hypothetical protein
VPPSLVGASGEERTAPVPTAEEHPPCTVVSPGEPLSQPIPSSAIGPFSPPRSPIDSQEIDGRREGTDRGEHPLVLRLPVGTRLADAERKLILLTLEAVRGNKQRAARVLGISRRGLYSKLQAYGEHVGGQESQETHEIADTQEAPEDMPSASDEIPAESTDGLELPRCSS